VRSGFGIKLLFSGFISMRTFLKMFTFGAKMVAWFCEGAGASNWNGLSSTPVLPIGWSVADMDPTQLYDLRINGYYQCYPTEIE